MKQETERIIDDLWSAGAKYSKKEQIIRQISEAKSERSEEIEGCYGETRINLSEYMSEQKESFSSNPPVKQTALLNAPPKEAKKPEKVTCENDILIPAISGLAMYASGILWVLGIALESTVFGMIINFFTPILFLGCIAIWFVYGMPRLNNLLNWQLKTKKYDEELTEWERKLNEAESDESIIAFEESFKNYDNAFLAMVANCDKKYEDEVLSCTKKIDNIEKQYAKKEKALNKELSEARKELEEVTVLHHDLIPHAYRIADILEKGRASELSDAINIALQDVQSEIAEAERRAEAARQEAILEEQAYESRRHNEAMERAEREHNIAMERAAKDQARAAEKQQELAEKQQELAEKQQELAEKQYREAQRAASARCMRCANYSKCGYQAKQNAVNCAAYTPR